jgi:hydrogenase-4 component E
MMTLFFLTVVFFHVAKKNFGVAVAYGIQSFLIVVLLVGAFFKTGDTSLLSIALIMLVVKVALAPAFMVQLIKKHELKFLVSSYASLPLTLTVVAALTATAYSGTFTPLVTIVPANQQLLSLALASMLVSLFLVVNRRGALSQIIGILSLENSIVAFAFFAGLEQTAALQVGTIFDISVWFVIATVFTSMVYKHFGTIDVTEMKKLKD